METRKIRGYVIKCTATAKRNFTEHGKKVTTGTVENFIMAKGGFFNYTENIKYIPDDMLYKRLQDAKRVATKYQNESDYLSQFETRAFPQNWVEIYEAFPIYENEYTKEKPQEERKEKNMIKVKTHEHAPIVKNDKEIYPAFTEIDFFVNGCEFCGMSTNPRNNMQNILLINSYAFKRGTSCTSRNVKTDLREDLKKPFDEVMTWLNDNGHKVNGFSEFIGVSLSGDISKI